MGLGAQLQAGSGEHWKTMWSPTAHKKHLAKMTSCQMLKMVVAANWKIVNNEGLAFCGMTKKSDSVKLSESAVL